MLEAWEVIKWFSQYEVRGLMYEQEKYRPDPVVVRDYIKTDQNQGFAEFAETLIKIISLLILICLIGKDHRNSILSVTGNFALWR